MVIFSRIANKQSEAEKEFIASGLGIDRRLVMHNDFVIVGPPADPAAVHTRTSAPEAFQTLFASAATSVSRGDQSGTHDRMLAEAADHVERVVSIRRDIRTAMIYPIFVFATIFAVMGTRPSALRSWRA